MLFNSVAFLFFFPIVTLIYYLLPYKYRWIHLLTFSCVFYMWFIPTYILILFVLIVIDYIAAIYIEKSQGRLKFYLLLLSVFSTCLALVIFKYYNFFADNVIVVFNQFGLTLQPWELKIILPVGLSFHTFQSLSYVIEVYRGKYKPERHIGIYALYVMFYPQLVAGPIERPQSLIPQLKAKHDFNFDRLIDSLHLMAWGFFKKIVVADRLSVITEKIFSEPTTATGPVLLMTSFLMVIQLYCDFSGYTDIARASARVLGIDLSLNFNRAFFAKSTSELWRRYHISLISWFRDYVYIPLAGSRERMDIYSRIRRHGALLATFLLSGLWHGANWTFIIWGSLNGFYIIFSNITQEARHRLVSYLPSKIQNSYVPIISNLWTVFLFAFFGIFFRVTTVSAGIEYIKGLTKGWGNPIQYNLIDTGPLLVRWQITPSFNVEISWFVITLIFVFIFFLVDWLQGKPGGFKKIFFNLSPSVRLLFYYCYFITMIFGGVYAERQFIYFQF